MAALQNGVRCIDGDHTIYLNVTEPHHIAEHRYADGKVLQIAGGLGWPQRGGDVGELAEQDRYQDLCLAEDDLFDWVAPRLLWGIGDAVLIKDMDRAALESVIATTDSFKHAEVARYWLARLGETQS